MLLPLCGKTRDIAWLLSQGYRVVGIELAEAAIEQLFIGLALSPEITPIGKLTRYSAQNITIFVGDIFDVSKDLIGTVHAVYDRAALVALPREMRGRYASHITAITQVTQLLIVYEYDQTLMSGPPFSISHNDIK